MSDLSLPFTYVNTTRRHLQRGVSLISLMVGLIISLIVVLGMLAVYKTTIHIAVTSGQDAKHDGELASGLLAAQMQLQGAGFQIENATYGTHLQVLSGAALPQGGGAISGTNMAAGAEGNAVVWASVALDGSMHCGALLPAGDSGGLAYSSTACANAASWSSTNWPAPSVLVSKGHIQIIAQTTPCKPFGIEKGDGGAQVTFSTLNSNAAVTTSSVCLANFPS